MVAEPPIVQEAESVRTRLRLLVLVAAVAGVAALAGLPTVGGARGLVGGIALAVLFWSGAAFLHLTWLAAPAPEKRTRRAEVPDGGVEFRIGLRPNLPLSTLVAGVGMLVFFATLAIAFGTSFWMLAGGLMVLLGLVVIPDSIRALAASGRGAVIDASGFTYNGFSYDAQVEWDDVESVARDLSNPRVPAFEFRLRPGARLSWTRRKWIARTEPDPSPNRFTIPAPVLDQPWDVRALCDGLARTPADRRAEYLDAVGSQTLVAAELGRN